MKNLKKISGLFLLFSCLAITLGSCSKDDDPQPQPPINVKDVNGSYSGKLKTVQGKKTNEAAVTFTAKDSVITFTELPVKEIVYAVAGDSLKAEEALKAIGKVKYSLNYTPTLTKTKTSVELAFSPKLLELQIPVDEAKKKVAVTFVAKEKGLYTTVGNDKALKFELVAEKIMVDSTALSPYEAIKYEFPLSKKK